MKLASRASRAKHIENIRNTTEKFEGKATTEGEKSFLGAPQTDWGTGKDKADAVYESGLMRYGFRFEVYEAVNGCGPLDVLQASNTEQLLTLGNTRVYVFCWRKL